MVVNLPSSTRFLNNANFLRGTLIDGKLSCSTRSDNENPRALLLTEGEKSSGEP